MPYCELPKRGVILVSGPDRGPFLQGLISNDVNKVGDGRALWAAHLTPQGKYLHDFFVFERNGVIGLECELDRLQDLGQRLSRFKLRADIGLDIDKESAVFVGFGENLCNHVGLPPGPGAAVPFANGIAFVDPRMAKAGFRCIAPRDAFVAEMASRAVEPCAFAAYDAHRLALGLPDGSRDLVAEKSILLENNFDELNGIDWNKGCYVGQELTARTKYRGLVKRRLVPVEIEGGPVEAGAKLELDGKDAGDMRSSLEGRGLAVVRLNALRQSLDGEPLVADGVRIRPLPPEWLLLD